MSIRLLEVEGFKSLKEVSWRPGDLNVVIGPNGSGKSNLLHFLELLRAAADGTLSQSIQHGGGIEAVLWDGRTRVIKTRIEITGTSYPLDAGEYLRYELTLESLGGWSNYTVAYELLESFSHDPETSSGTSIFRNEEEASIYDSRSNKLSVISDSKIPMEETLLSMDSPFTSWEFSYLNEDFREWAIYKGLSTTRDAMVRQAVLTRRETVVSSDGDNLIAVLHTLYSEDRDFRNELNAAMNAAFNDNFEELVFPPASDQRVQLRVNWKHLKRSQSSAMLSDGTLRFLYLMAILANPEPPALIAIEEPEVGLHPSMFPIIAEYAAQASKRTQVILTTHSADFLDAFRDTGVTPTTTVTQWRDGATTLKVLEGDELAYWLREYTLGQLFRSSELEQIG